MKDKNDVEITDGCYCRIKYNYGDGDGYLIDGIYRITLHPFRGLIAKLVSLITPEMTTRCDLRWEYGLFSPDYPNERTDRLAIKDTTGHGFRSTPESWKEQHYSTDIEVI